MYIGVKSCSKFQIC